MWSATSHTIRTQIDPGLEHGHLKVAEPFLVAAMPNAADRVAHAAASQPEPADMDVDAAQGSQQAPGAGPAVATPPPGILAVIPAQLSVLPAIQGGQSQLAADLSSLVGSFEAQQAATKLSSKIDSLSARVAAFEKSRQAPTDEVHSSGDEQAEQKTKYARPAAGKARPRSSSPAVHVPAREERPRAASNPSRVTPPTTHAAPT